MPNRIIKESSCSSDQIDQLSWIEEVLFSRLMVNADDFGRFDGRVKMIRSKLFPLKDIREATIEEALRKLSSVELVELYTVRGQPFIRLTGWDRHQTIRNQKSKYPGPREDSAAAITAYASGNLQYLSPRNMEELESFRADLPDDVIRYGIDEACANGKRTWAYVKAILNRYVQDGVKTVGDIRAREQNREKCTDKSRITANNPALAYEQRTTNERDYANLLLDLTGGGE